MAHPTGNSEQNVTRRPLLVNGFMASGKTTVARLVAERCGAQLVDLDQRIEQREGASVATLFAQRGEAAFRQAEARALDELVEAGGEVVVALGGGALLERARRLRALDASVTVTLEASLDSLLERAGDQPGQRPLLTGEGSREAAGRLLEQRAVAYAECHARIDTTGRTPNEVAAQVAEVWARDAIAVAAGLETYSVEVRRGVAVERARQTLAAATRVVLVTDENVGPLHAEPFVQALGASRVERIDLPAGEAHKTLATAEGIWKRAQQAGLDRSSAFLAVGGGVVTDVAGFAAACWMRGVRWVGVPTTLLSMVDASVGGKTAVDLGKAKNCVGAFCQPAGVYCDVAFAATEPARGMAALAEVVKTALIGDPELLGLLSSETQRLGERDPDVMEEIVRRCVRVKARVVGLDTQEGGVRAWLNLGHTIGHALEAIRGYERLTHGEAVSLGLVAALRIGEFRGVTPRGLTREVVALLAALGLPTDLRNQPLEESLSLLSLDKKRSGDALRFIMVREAGQLEVETLPIAEVRRLALQIVA